jgi:hypothetical protein
MVDLNTMRLSKPAIALALAAIPLAAVATTRWLERAARDAGSSLASEMRGVRGVRATVGEESAGVAPPEETEVTEGSEDADAPLASDTECRDPRTTRHARQRRRTVFVDQQTVLRLASSGFVPSGTPVAQTVTAPAGIALFGVSALGLGVQDGDVLTSVSGRAVRTEGQVIARVIAARARQERNISAVFWHHGAPCSLVVEMPYVSQPSG